jgi:hypothetical protein
MSGPKFVEVFVSILRTDTFTLMPHANLFIFASRYGGPLRPPRLPDIGPVIALVIFAVMLSAFVPFIIDWLRPGKADKPADSKDEPPKASDKLGKCPKCGEELEPQFEACWKCGTVRKPDGEHPA